MYCADVPERVRRGGLGGAKVYFAISDPTRRRILDLLRGSELSVVQLAKPFRMSQPAVSQHLRVLREAGLVTATRAGRERHYRLRAQRLREVYDWVAHYQKFWTEKLGALGDLLDEEESTRRGRQT
jgi:DNA-binding transcriptional ArsR family regulator